MQEIIICGECNQSINVYETAYIEFDNIFYHKQCYSCQYCSVSFKIDNFVETNSIPLKDKFNRLVCVKDFIRTLNCHVCKLNFDLNSQVYKLNSNNVNVCYLAHVECVKCESCETKIEFSNEYILKENGQLVCKPCSLAVKSAKRTLRLSSRQKEIIESKLIQSNLNLLMEYDDIIVLNLAKEADCSVKTLVNFIALKQEKSKSKVNLAGENILKNQKIDMMLDELKKMDKVLAPNQSPFTQKHVHHKTNFIKS